jgi:hypothetical protein
MAIVFRHPNPIRFALSYVVGSEGARGEQAMGNDKLIAGEGVLIGRDHWDVPVRVELRAYLRFSRRMNKQLHRLVVRWAHAASPFSRGVPATRAQTETFSPPIP